MLLSFETPLCKIKNNFNDYTYYLDVFNDPETRDFHKRSEFGYLDNSLYERHHYNLKFSPLKYLKNIMEFKNLYYMIPDKFVKTKEDIQKNIDYLNEFKEIGKNKIAVVHGSNFEEYQYMYNYINDNFDDSTIIAFSGDISQYMMRSEAIYKLSLNPEKKHHILGLSYPKEILEIREIKDKIFSLDTSLPIICSIEKKIIESVVHENKKPNLKIYDVYYKKDLEFSNLEFNIQYIKNLLN